MAVEYRDYYDILGVDKSASQDDIKRAFKKLARKYHPDIAKDEAEAETKFKEVNEAYEVLGDPEKRKKYDALGPNWEQAADFSGAGGPGGFGGGGGPGGFSGFPGGFSGTDEDGVHYEYHFDGSTGFSDFFENLFGGRTAGDPFGAFGAGGPGSGGPRRSRGAQPMAGQDIEADLLVRIEEIMQGATREIRFARPTLEGPPKESTIRVKVPKGVTEGQMIRCAGMGYPGIRGGPDGDLYLRVRIERHPSYKVSGHDLTSELVLAPWDVVLGKTVTTPTPHGDVKLTVKPGTQPGTRMRVRGKGLPDGSGGFGDLYVTVAVEYPPSPSEEERKLWRELAEKSSFEPND